MRTYILQIKDIAKSHNQTISVCNALVNQYKTERDTKLIIDFSDCDFIYPDYAILLLCSIKYIESLGIKVSGTLNLAGTIILLSIWQR